MCSSDLELGLESVQAYNHELALHSGRELARRWNTSMVAPPSMIGAMVTIPLPQRLGATSEDAIRVRDILLFEKNIEVHVYAWKGRLRVRVSTKIYNEFADVERLINAVDSI